MWMLDTNICSYILRKHPLVVKSHLEKVGPENASLSSIVLAELYYGASRHPKSVEIRSDIDDFVGRLWVFPWDRAAADQYGDIRSHLERQGTPIGAMDMLIAAHARSLDAVLVTNNLRHFDQVPGLRVEDWDSQILT